MITLNLVHMLAELEELRYKCEGRFSCTSCPLAKEQELCEMLLLLPEQIAKTIYGGENRC